MTPKGRRLVGHLGPKVEQVYAEIREQLGPENLANLYEDLERVIALPDTGKGAASPARRPAAGRHTG
jgi:hypothetical protein